MVNTRNNNMEDTETTVAPITAVLSVNNFEVALFTYAICFTMFT